MPSPFHACRHGISHITAGATSPRRFLIDNVAMHAITASLRLTRCSSMSHTVALGSPHPPSPPSLRGGDGGCAAVGPVVGEGGARSLLNDERRASMPDGLGEGVAGKPGKPISEPFAAKEARRTKERCRKRPASKLGLVSDLRLGGSQKPPTSFSTSRIAFAAAADTSGARPGFSSAVD